MMNPVEPEQAATHKESNPVEKAAPSSAAEHEADHGAHGKNSKPSPETPETEDQAEPHSGHGKEAK